MEKLLIIDGHCLLFQMFCGLPIRIVDKYGKPMNAVMGFICGILKTIKIVEPNRILVIFDGENVNFRTNLNEDYKANRVDFSVMPEDESPFTQLPNILKALEYMKVSYHVSTQYEADDIIASYCLQYGVSHNIVVSSFDSDFFQLINDNVTIFRYRGESSVVCDSAYVLQKLGIKTSLYADFKSLTGDKADNITGIRSVGPKTAAKLINQYGSILKIIENLSEIKQNTIREAIAENPLKLINNYELIKLSNRASIPIPLEHISLAQINTTSSEVLKAIGLK